MPTETKKFTVHLFPTVRVPITVEAENQIAAIEAAEQALISRGLWDFAFELCNSTMDAIVDPLAANGDTLYDEVRSYAYDSASDSWQTEAQPDPTEDVIAAMNAATDAAERADEADDDAKTWTRCDACGARISHDQHAAQDYFWRGGAPVCSRPCAMSTERYNANS